MGGTLHDQRIFGAFVTADSDTKVGFEGIRALASERAALAQVWLFDRG
jgi:hypothetical protein